MSDERGYVIRCHNLLDGSTDFRGNKSIFARTKDGFTMGDTYTLSGAKRALSNMRRLCFDPDRYQYSIERLDECYLQHFSDVEKKIYSQHQLIEKAKIRLDELWEGNNFDNGDKMRINEIRSILRMLKEALRDQ